MKKAKFNTYQMITDRIIEQIEAGGSNWLKPFKSASFAPFNASSKKEYQGINTLVLGLSGLTPIFGTYKQWADLGAQVSKGQKGLPVVFFKMLEGKKTDIKTGKKETFPMLRYSTAFSIDQVENAPKRLLDLAKTDDSKGSAERIESVENYVVNTEAVVKTATGTPCYIPSIDEIRMPPADMFLDNEDGTATEHYYATLLHELTHWTGNKDRLNRLSDKGREGYAFEELVAELGAVMQCVRLGIDSEPRADHAKYLASWLKALKSDNKYIFKAAKLAQKAIEHCDELQPIEAEKAA